MNRLLWSPRSAHLWLFFAYAALLVLPMALLFVPKPILLAWFGQGWWIVPFSVTLSTALIAPFVYVSLQRRVQEQIQERRRQVQQTFLHAAHGMTLIKETHRLLNLIVHILTRTVGVEEASLWLLEKKSRQFKVQASRGQLPFHEEYAIAVNQPFIQYLVRLRNPLPIQEELKKAVTNGRLKYLIPVVEEMNRIKAAIVIPSFVGGKLLGFVAMGPKKSGQPYTPQDLEGFEVMANQAALAIENAQFYEELQRTQADLFQTGKMATLGHMAGGMSHQINNRFHVLSILAGTMKSAIRDLDPTKSLEAEKIKELWAKTLETFDKIEENALRGGDIVKTMLRFSRPAQEYQWVEIPQVLETAREVAQFRVNFHQIDLVQQMPEDLPPIKGDLNQLADSIFNLISNAYDATQKKAELIQTKQLPLAPEDPYPFHGRVQVRARAENLDGKSWVALEFRDNGIGMSPQELENLFIPFFTTKASSQKGTGLGLYVIQRIIERHGGTISATSAYGVGTCFTIRLPASAEAPSGQTRPATNEAARG